jgi:hypothetical protein
MSAQPSTLLPAGALAALISMACSAADGGAVAADGAGAQSSGFGGAAASSGGVGGATGPATCSEAAGPYDVSAVPLDASLVPASTSSGWNAESFAHLRVAVDPMTNEVYVGFTSQDGAAVVAGAQGTATTTPNATSAGIAVTSDGFAQLLFDPNPEVDARMWASVKRFGRDGTERFSTDLFRSPNLDDVGTKGAPGGSRFGYLAATDELVAYFGHTERYDDGVRHQGGYLATLDSGGAQEVIDDWFGSHNLDQRLLISESTAAVLGLGDAYPKGIFFSLLDRARANVIYPLAATGNGSTNGQLGGMVELDSEIIVPFVTNRSLPQDLDAGTWPDLDEAIVDEIRAAAENGTDLALLRVPRVSDPGELSAVWLEPQLAEGAHLEQLKSARYGTGGLVLLAWAEVTGSGRSAAVSGYYTMVVDREGGVCQPKTPLDSQLAFTAGDDIVRRPDGTIVWANSQGGVIQIVTLAPQ